RRRPRQLPLVKHGRAYGCLDGPETNAPSRRCLVLRKSTNLEACYTQAGGCARDTGRAMSQETVQIVREAMALIRRAGAGEPEPRLFELLAPDMTLDMSRRTFNPEVYKGHDGLSRFKRERDE